MSDQGKEVLVQMENLKNNGNKSKPSRKADEQQVAGESKPGTGVASLVSGLREVCW